MILTTTPAIEGKKVAQYHGIVTGEAILGANIVRDLFASVRDVVGGRSAAYEKELAKARDMAMNAVEAHARELGANAVVGIDIDYETVGTGSMLMVTVCGTAVTLSE